jgi:hypothetical protein
VKENRKSKIKIERKTVFDQKKKKIIDLLKITIYQNLANMEILEFSIAFEKYMTYNKVEDENLQERYLIHAISRLVKIIFKKLRLEGLLIKKLWKKVWWITLRMS